MVILNIKLSNAKKRMNIQNGDGLASLFQAALTIR